MGVQRIPNGSLHYASGTLETLSHDPACKSFRETEREREKDGGGEVYMQISRAG